MLLCAAAPAAAADVTLTITGDGVTEEVVFTYEQLEAMSDLVENQVYTAYNTWPTAKVYYAEVVPIKPLLEQAGLKAEATTINIAAESEGDDTAYNSTFLLADLLAERYSFFDGKKTVVPAAVALKLGESGPDAMDKVDLRNIHGQLAENEQTSPSFVQSTRVITVTCAPIQQLPLPELTVAEKDGQYEIALSNSNYNAKIYYTLDGSTPTVHSEMYNVSAEHWQPQLNQPFLIAGDTTVKAIAVVSGFADSEVLTFTPNAQEQPAEPAVPADSFTDVPAGHWAATEVEALVAQGVLSGMGDGLFKPDQELTRAQFAKIMVLVINKAEPAAATESQFSDVTAADWHAGYVAEAVNLGLFNGYEDGTFRPDVALSKEEMLTIAVRALPEGEAQAAQAVADGKFAADGDVAAWALGYVEYAYAKGLIPEQMLGMKSGLLNITGQAAATRAEAAYVAGRM